MIAFSAARRRLLGGAGAAGVAGITQAMAALTPPQTRGPFYPLTLPLDDDNNLVEVAGQSQRARGEVTDLFGHVRDTAGRALPGVQVEIWQCDAHGRYHHPRDRGPAPDPGFQGYGRTTTAADGSYRFRTIRPVPYPGRTPHIHFALSGANVRPLITQMYVAGDPRNARDGLFRALGEASARVLVELAPAGNAGVRWQGRFDIVLASGQA